MTNYKPVGVVIFGAIIYSPVVFIWVYYKLRRRNISFSEIYDMYNDKRFRNLAFFTIFFLLAISIFVIVFLYFGRQTSQTYTGLQNH